MRALTLQPGRAGSARLEEIDEPVADRERPTLLVESVALGLCHADRAMLRGEHGWAPLGADRIVLGHESLGRVLEAPPGSGFRPGELVVGVVRRPCPVPCLNCAVGEFDACASGRYGDRGMKELDGFAAERWRIEPAFAVKVDAALGLRGVLVEPASLVAKAWEAVDRAAERMRRRPQTALVTGGGTLGLLAALFAVQRGLETHVIGGGGGRAPSLFRRLGAHYHGRRDAARVPAVDVVMESTGASELGFDAFTHVLPTGLVCLAGVSSVGPVLERASALPVDDATGESRLLVGGVNANRRHYEAAARALALAEPAWLDALITRRLPLERWEDAARRERHDLKTVLCFDEAAA